MSLSDLFGFKKETAEKRFSQEQAKLVRIVRSSSDMPQRLEALRSIVYLPAVKDLLEAGGPNDLTPEIRQLVVSHLASLGFFTEFLKIFSKEPEALEAVIQCSESSALENALAAAADLPKTLRSALLKRIDDPARLTTALSQIESVKILKTLVAEISPARVDKMIDSADQKLAPILLSRINKESRLKELAENGTPAVRQAALNFIKDREFLKKAAGAKNEESVREAARARFESTRPVYYEYQAHMDCPECRGPMILNYPALKAPCASCGSAVNIGEKFWARLFRASETSGVFIMGQRVGVEPGKKRPPHCPDCGQVLNTDDIPNDTDGFFACDSCKKSQAVFPAPSWMKKMTKGDKKSPVQILCAEKESGEDAAASPPSPIAFSCISCGGSLKLSADTPRILTCEYCQTQQFLPGALWHAIHPVKKIRKWYIKYE